MNDNLACKLQHICEQFTLELESKADATGMCYLIGHCLAEGFTNAGMNALETIGHLILKDKNDKPIVYGDAKYKGAKIGEYHTWCVLNVGDTKIILDPSLKYNKVAIKQLYKLKVNAKIPDLLISDSEKTWHYEYITDASLASKSKHFLNNVPPELVSSLISKVQELVVSSSLTNELIVTNLNFLLS